MLPEPEMIREIHRLTLENNKMLHAMRRHNFIGGIIKIIIWATLILVPIWLYMQYLAPVLKEVLTTVTQIQTTGANAQAQMADWQKMIQDLQSKIPGLSSTSSN
jgi:hypothetical protein